MPAVQLPNGKQQFVDENGAPYALGSVTFYIPNTTTPKDTYQDEGQTILNTNPIALDAGGYAVIWGQGLYRQILKDVNGVTIWDQVVGFDQTGNSSTWASIELVDGGLADVTATDADNVLIVPTGEDGLIYLGNAAPGRAVRLMTSSPINVLFGFDNYGAGPTLQGLNQFMTDAGQSGVWVMTTDDTLTMVSTQQTNTAGARIWQAFAYTTKTINVVLRPNGSGHTDPPDNLFVIGKPTFYANSNQPAWSFMVDPQQNSGSGKAYLGQVTLYTNGDTSRILLSSTEPDGSGNPQPTYLFPNYISGRPLVTSPLNGKLDYINPDWPDHPGIPGSVNSIYQGWNARIDFDTLAPPTSLSTPGVLCFSAATGTTYSPYGISPWGRMWLHGISGNIVIVGKAAWEAGDGAWHATNAAGVKTPAGFVDYLQTGGDGNLSLIATDIESATQQYNATLSVRVYTDQTKGADWGYASSTDTLNRYAVSSGARTVIERVYPALNVVTYPSKPAFQAQLTADVSSVTGDGTNYTVVWNAEIVDQNNNFNTSTGTFTAPVAGVYHFSANVTLGNYSATSRTGLFVSLTCGSRTLARSSGAPVADASGNVSTLVTATTLLAAADTVTVQVKVTGAAKTCNVLWGGATTTPVSWFSGFLVG